MPAPARRRRRRLVADILRSHQVLGQQCVHQGSEKRSLGAGFAALGEIGERAADAAACHLGGCPRLRLRPAETLFEHAGHLLLGQGQYPDALAAGRYGAQDLFRSMGHKDEKRLLRRFLYALQQAVGSILVHLFG